jgi:two-component system cell cycle sensor histidine kinase/response regulator CckA
MNISTREFKRKKKNTNLTDRKSIKTSRVLPETIPNQSKVENSDHKRAEKRLGKINECFLSFETNPDENINHLVALCGKELGATCALYNRLKDGLLHSVGRWNTPIDYIPVDKPDGHICYDLIQSGQNEARLIRNLPKTIYAKTDPNVIRYGLKTYVGETVTFGGTIVGSLCVVYQKDYIPSEDDKKFLGIIASAIGVEENRKRAEEAMLKSQQMLEKTFASLREAVFIIDANTVKIIDCNPSATKIFGYSRDEMLERTTTFLHVDESALEEFRRHLYPAIKEKGFLFLPEFKMKRKDGTVFHTKHHVSSLEDQQGNRIGWVSVVRDITEQKHAEEALRRSEESAKRLAQENAIMAAIGRIISSTLNIDEVYERFAEEVSKFISFDRIAINIVNTKDNIVNIAYATGTEIQERRQGDIIPLAGSLTDEIVRTRSSRLIQTENRAELVEHFPYLLPTFQAGFHSMMSVPLISKDEVVGVLHLRSTKPNAYTESDLRLAERVGNQIAGAIANAQLFAEHKRTEEALRESERKFKDLYDNAPLGYHEYDVEGRITNVNRTDLEMLGYTAEEMIGLPIWKLNVNEEKVREQVMAKLAGTMPPGKELERTYRRKDGTTFPVLIEDRLILDEKGRIKGIRCTIQDITGIKQAEEALQRSEETAKRIAQENATMAEIGRIISSTLNIEEVYERFAEEVRKLITFEGIAINIINHKEGTVTIPYVSGIAVPGRQPGATFPLEGSVAEKAVRTHSGLIVQMEDKNELQARFPALLPVFEKGLRSVIAVPLISKDQVIGTIHFRSAKPKAYSDQDLRLAERVGTHIAGTVANAQLFAERKQAEEALKQSEETTKQLAKENAIMAEIGRIVSSTLNIEEVYEKFAEEVRKLLPFDRIAVSILNHNENTLNFAYVSGIKIPDRRKGGSLPLKNLQLNEQVIHSRSGILVQINDEKELMERFPSVLPTFKAGLRSMMSVPLISKDEVIGVLHLRSTKPNGYTERDLRLVERVGYQIAGAIANAQLFAEVKLGKEALRKSEAKFKDLFDEAPVGYMALDTEARITEVNRTELAMLGYTAEEMIGQPIWKFVVEEEECRQSIMAKLSGSMQPGKVFERTYRRKDGTTLPVLIEDAFLRDAKGRITGIHSIIQDVTERKQAEEEKAALQEQLRQSQKMEAIGQLAGGIAHDFNNLLTVIKGYSQLSLLELKEGDPLWGNLQEIQKSAQRATDLTRQLLAFSRRQILDFKVLDLNMLLQDLDNMLRRILGEDVELIYGLVEDLGKVKTDPGQFEQVILNLVVNARDAMPSGGKLIIETANVELDETYARTHIGATPGHYVMVSVSDTGYGMSSEVKEHIFEPFFTTKEKGKGTGLGLPTVYGIVKQSGGYIWADSKLGCGTTFKIYLPRVEEEASFFHRRDDTNFVPCGNETILIVEDEPSVLRLAVQVLLKQGYTLLEAVNGEEALHIVQEQDDKKINLLLTDVVMPQMGGKELADQLKTLHPDIKVLYISGYTDDAIVHHGVLEPGTNFLQKPFSPAALTHKVREALDR